MKEQTNDTPHNHRCTNCRKVWHHDPNSIPQREVEFDLAHTCPNCGTYVSMIDQTGGVPQYCNNGVRLLHLQPGDRPASETAPPHMQRLMELMGNMYGSEYEPHYQTPQYVGRRN